MCKEVEGIVQDIVNRVSFETYIRAHVHACTCTAKCTLQFACTFMYSTCKMMSHKIFICCNPQAKIAAAMKKIGGNKLVCVCVCVQ